MGLVDKTNTPPANGMRPQERNLSITDFPPLPTLPHNTQSENEQRNEKAPQLQEEQYTAEPNGPRGNLRAEPTAITQSGQNIYHIPSTEEVMEELHEVTLQYLNCPDPKEAAARRQRVLISDAIGDMEEAASTITAAAIRNAPQQPTVPQQQHQTLASNQTKS